MILMVGSSIFNSWVESSRRKLVQEVVPLKQICVLYSSLFLTPFPGRSEVNRNLAERVLHGALCGHRSTGIGPTNDRLEL